MHDAPRLRIGELSRRTGVAPELLRAWERRYGLLQPERSAGGFRLYGLGDLRRVQSMLDALAGGASASEAARLALAAPVEQPREQAAAGAGAALQRALDVLDDAAAQAAFDELLGRFSVDSVLRDVVLPYLHELGGRWERGEASVAQEHFASALLRGRLLGLARGWSQGAGPRAVIACAPGELHDLSTIVFGVALRGRGWRITYLGPDTPLESVAEAAERTEPALVVLVAIASRQLPVERDALAALAARRPLALAGAAVDEQLARAVGARLLTEDPVAAAEALAAERASAAASG